MKKILVITSAILLLAAACNKQAAVSPAPAPTTSTNQTANWKTYTNTKYGFEFNYPADFVIEDTGQINCDNNSGTCPFLKNGLQLTIKHNGFEGQILISTPDNPPLATITDVDQWLKTVSYYGDEIINDSYKIADLPTVHTFLKSISGANGDTFYFIKDTRLFQIFITLEGTGNNAGKSVDLKDKSKWYNTFLESFEFIK